MSKVNRLVLCREDYGSQEEFENEIKKAIMLLLNANYIMSVKYDDGKEDGIIVIDYNYSEQEYGERYPFWLLPEEEETVVYLH